MKIMWIVIFCLFVPKLGFAQDERFFRNLFSGEFIQEKKEEEKKYSYTIHTPEYLMDLNNDLTKESLVYVKRDSEDWLDVFNSQKDKIFSYRFEVKGVNSGLFRVTRKVLDENTTLLVLYFYEGETNYLSYESSARVYLLTIPNNDLKKMTMFKGPSIFEEKKSYKAHYHLKNYSVSVVDLNGDHRKELIVKNRDISQVFFYTTEGVWKTYKN